MANRSAARAARSPSAPRSRRAWPADARSVFRPCWSPRKICSGTSTVSSQSVIDSMTLRFVDGAALAQQIGGDAEHDEAGGDVEADDRVGEAIGEGRVEDDLRPVRGKEAAVDDLVAGRRLHPAVGGQNPEGREQRARAPPSARRRNAPSAAPACGRTAARRGRPPRGRRRSGPHRRTAATRHWRWRRRSGSSWCRTGTA